MYRAKSICRRVGCNVLVSEPGFCHIHKNYDKQRFQQLNKATGSRQFYGGTRWTKTAKAYRRRYPLCAQHKAQGLIVKGALVDHKVERGKLVSMGLDPYDFEYLQTLCVSCHNKKLRERQSKAKGFI